MIVPITLPRMSISVRTDGKPGFEQFKAAVGAHADRLPGTALVGGGQRIGVGPQLRIMRVAGGEHTHHGPGLVAQGQRLADLHVAELALGALADHDLAQAGGELAALNDLDLVMHGPRLRADAAELRVDVGAIGLGHQVDHL